MHLLRPPEVPLVSLLGKRGCFRLGVKFFRTELFRPLKRFVDGVGPNPLQVRLPIGRARWCPCFGVVRGGRLGGEGRGLAERRDRCREQDGQANYGTESRRLHKKASHQFIQPPKGGFDSIRASAMPYTPRWPAYRRR